MMEALIGTVERSLQPQTFEEFYRVQWQEIFRPLAVTLGDPDLARDAVDEGMVRAYQRWSTVRRYDNPAGWVYRTSLNWARSRLRKLRRESRRTPPDRSSLDPEPADPALYRAVAGLPLHHRAVVVLRYLCDMSQEQVAAYLDVPIGTVRSRLHRALTQLRSEVVP